MILKSILIIISIILWVAYNYLRFFGGGIIGLGLGFSKKGAPFEEKIVQSIVLWYAPLIAALATITIAILKSLEFVDFSLWWITIPVIFDIIISVLTVFIWKKFL